MIPPSLAAHGAEVGLVIVPGDHVLPGDTIPVIVSGMDPGAEVLVTLGDDERSAVLGRLILGPDGSGEATFQVPREFPLGYSRVTASMPNGDHATAVVLVGPRAEGPNQTPSSAPELDPRLLALGLLALGLVVAWMAILRLRRA